jgi:hypothetical protein
MAGIAKDNREQGAVRRAHPQHRHVLIDGPRQVAHPGRDPPAIDAETR